MKRLFVAVVLIVLLMLTLFAPSVAAEGAPDLVVTDMAWQGDGQVQPNTVLTFTVTVKNEGTAAVTEAFTVDIGFGTERLFRLTCEQDVPVGGTVTVTSPAWTATSGDRMLTARVNSTNTVAETESWDNDTMQRNLRIGTERYQPSEGMREAVTEAGMFDLTFNDDFNDTDWFDVEQTGVEGYKWYTRRHSAFQKFTEGDYSTENGILTMACKIDTFAIGGATIDRRTGIGYTFTNGYLEFRLRMPKAGEFDESKTAIWSFPRERYVDGGRYTTHVEMDWLEYYGGNYYTVTLHEMNTPIGQPRDWYASKNGSFDGLGDEQWHTMGYLWEKGRLRCYLDGKLFHTQTWGEGELPMPINDVREGEIKFEGVFSYADTQDMMLFIFGSKSIPLELDYIRVWQAGGEAPTPPTTTTKPTTTTTATKKPTVTTKQPTTSTTVTTATKQPTASTTVTTSTTVPTVPTEGTTVPTAETGPTADEPTAEPKKAMWWLYAVGAAVVLLGGAAAVLIVKRK